jgi:hypothetical protein
MEYASLKSGRDCLSLKFPVLEQKEDFRPELLRLQVEEDVNIGNGFCEFMHR